MIDTEIKKRRNKWLLSKFSGIDFEDISQIIRIHIFKKWSLFDPAKKIEPWLNTIISNQLKNLIRNNYGNYSKPCTKCGAAEANDKCSIYSEQCSSCPLYAKWEKTKQAAFNLKRCQSTEENHNTIASQEDESYGLEKNIKDLNSKIHLFLKPNELKFYKLFYLESNTEEVIAKRMGFTTGEKNRKPGYKQIQNIKKNIVKKIKKAISEGKIDVF